MFKTITLLALLISTQISTQNSLTLEEKLVLVVDQVERTLDVEVNLLNVKLVDSINGEEDMNAAYSAQFKSILVKRSFFASATNLERTAVVAHEMGHALGLEHSEDGIMHADTHETIMAVKSMGIKTAINDMLGR